MFTSPTFNNGREVDNTDKRQLIVTACEKKVRTNGWTVEVNKIVSRMGSIIELLMMISTIT